MQFRRITAMAAVAVASLSLSGCLVLPGEFESEMSVMRSGQFSFSYKGEIQLVGLATLLNNDLENESTPNEFEATCWTSPDDDKDKAEKEAEEKKQKKLSAARQQSSSNASALGRVRVNTTGTASSAAAEEDYDLLTEEQDKDEATEAAKEGAAEAAEAAAEAAEAVAASDADFEYEERECTAEEIAEQKKEWDERQARRARTQEEQQQMFSLLLGGIDPKDPKTIERFTKEVERLAAWHKVEHLGNGKFTIDYSTSGMLADDFAFPVIPRYAIGEPMIHITRWDNGRLRVEAPSFHNDPDFSMLAMFGAGSALGGLGRTGSKPPEPLETKGTFTLKTDAPILANNTDEGPAQDESGMQILTWEIGPRTFGPPMALLRLR